MGISTGRDLHIDQNLTNVALNYRPVGMIADMIAPIVPVQKETDLYPVFSQAEAFAIESTLRSRGTRAQRITRSVSSAGYTAKNYALAYDLPIEDRANMDAAYAFELESGAARYLVDKLTLDWDRRVLSTVGSASNVATGFLTGSAWNGATNGDPISQIYRAIEQIQGSTAYRPNRLLFGWQAYNLFRRNTNVRNFVLGTNNGGGILSRSAVAGIFEVEQVLVAEAFYNSANEAKAMTLASTFPADAVLAYYTPSGPSREVPSFMYSFRWNNPALPAPLAVERHPYDTKQKVESIEAGYYQDEKITSSALGALLLGVGSAQATGLT
jgi:hypothetical protein